MGHVAGEGTTNNMTQGTVQASFILLVLLVCLSKLLFFLFLDRCNDGVLGKHITGLPANGHHCCPTCRVVP